MMPLGLIDSVLYDIRFESVIIPPYVISLLPLVSTTDFPVLIPILALFTLNGANCYEASFCVNEYPFVSGFADVNLLV